MGRLNIFGQHFEGQVGSMRTAAPLVQIWKIRPSSGALLSCFLSESARRPVAGNGTGRLAPTSSLLFDRDCGCFIAVWRTDGGFCTGRRILRNLVSGNANCTQPQGGLDRVFSGCRCLFPIS